MIKSTLRISLRSLLLLLYTFFLSGFYILNGSIFFSKKVGILLFVCAGIGLLKIFYIRKIKSSLDFCLVLLSCLIVVFFYLHSKDTRLIVAILSMVCYMNEDIEEIINYFFYSYLFFLITALVSGGFYQLNTIALYTGTLILIYVCKLDKEVQWKNIITVLLAFSALCLYTHTRSALVSMVILLILLFAVKIKKCKFLKSKIFVFIYPILLFFNYYFALCFNVSLIPGIGSFIPQKINDYVLGFVQIIDHLCSSRLTLAYFSIKEFGVSWLGGNVDYNKLQLSAGQYFNLDSGYMWLLQGWGGIMCIIFMIMSMFLMYYFIQTERYNYIIVAIVIALWSINEDRLISIGTNFLIGFTLNAIIYYYKQRKLQKIKTYDKLSSHLNIK